MRRVLAPIVVTALALLLATDTEGRVVAASTIEEAPSKTSRDIDPEKFKASSASLNLEVPDPVKAHGDAERLLVKLGAEVNSSSASTDSAHLSVRIPERRLQSALDAVRAIPGRVGNVNRNMNDFTQSAKSAAERLQRLDRADAEIVRAIKTASDSDAVDGLMLLRELSQNDRSSQESQIDSLRQESERAQLHISFSVLR